MIVRPWLFSSSMAGDRRRTRSSRRAATSSNTISSRWRPFPDRPAPAPGLARVTGSRRAGHGKIRTPGRQAAVRDPPHGRRRRRGANPRAGRPRCVGRLALPNPAGAGGLPPVGERAAAVDEPLWDAGRARPRARALCRPAGAGPGRRRLGDRLPPGSGRSMRDDPETRVRGRSGGRAWSGALAVAAPISCRGAVPSARGSESWSSEAFRDDRTLRARPDRSAPRGWRAPRQR